MNGVIRNRKALRAWFLAVLVGGGGALLASCNPDPGFVDDHNLNSMLINTWDSDSSSYEITATHVSYLDSDGEISFAGNIKYVSNFSETAGVIIIEYDAAYKPTYYDEWTENPPGSGTWVPGDELPLQGDFIGVYFKELTAGSARIASAYVAGGAEESTLADAKAAFTADSEPSYIYSYGSYSAD
jgi:hypothetical protein